MRISGDGLRRQIAGCLVMLLAVPFGVAATAGPQQAPSGQPSVPAQSQQSENATRNPATDRAQAEGSPDSPVSARSQSTGNNQQSDQSQSTSEQEQNGASKPVGTAAAPYERPMGVPASRPAGAVIAPAKQRRARSILIKVGVIVGAAIAIGAVVGASKGSPNRPN